MAAAQLKISEFCKRCCVWKIPDRHLCTLNKSIWGRGQQNTNLLRIGVPAHEIFMYAGRSRMHHRMPIVKQKQPTLATRAWWPAAKHPDARQHTLQTRPRAIPLTIAYHSTHALINAYHAAQTYEFLARNS